MPDAVSANTTLQILGRTRVFYGQPVWQDFVYMLENFANGTPPAYPIQGQLWYNDTTDTLSVYDGTTWNAINSGPTSSDLDMNGFKIINLGNPTAATDALNFGFAESRYVNISGDSMASGADLTFTGGGQVLGLPAVPVGATAAASKAYVDAQIADVEAGVGNNYLPLSGGTLTGPLTISSGNLTLQSGNISASGTLTINGASSLKNTTVDGTLTVTGASTVAGLTASGPVVFSSSLQANGPSIFTSPVSILATTVTVSGGGSLDMGNGYINNVGYPINQDQAASKQYVDDAVTSGGSTGTIVSGNISTIDGAVTLNRQDGSTVTLTGSAAPFVHQHVASDVSVAISGAQGNYLSQVAFADGSYPNMSDQRAVTALDTGVSTLLNNAQRYENVGAGAPTITVPFVYKVGSNKLTVFLNGVLQVLSRHAEGNFAFPFLLSGPATFLTTAGTYTMNLTVNGTLYTDFAITVPAGGVTYDGFVALLNGAFTSGSVPAIAYLDNNRVAVATTGVGAGMSVAFAPPSSGTSLLTTLTSYDAVISNGSSTFTGGYQEVGAVGSMSNQVTFVAAPTSSDMVTIICQPHLNAFVGL